MLFRFVYGQFQDGVIDTQEFKQLMESKFGANADIDVQV